jgi:protein-tyrosine-phosphatase
MKVTCLIAFFGLAGSAAAQAPSQTILFVCEHGAAKSVVAAGHFNKMAAARGLPFRAVSRGTAPDASVPAVISQGLQKEGLAVAPGFAPVLVTPSDVSTAARVVTLDVRLPVGTEAAQVIQWDGLPAFSDGYGPASAAIAAKVETLVRELERSMKK